MAGLVYVGKIVEINPIPNADRIESAIVVCGKGGKWQGTVKKGEFAVGDLCQVYLQDSLLPETPEFEFMRKYNFRVRMARLRGVPSEVLIMPHVSGDLGDDITEQAAVTKYEKPLPLSIGGDALGWFPPSVPKTDEPNFQTVPHLVEALGGLLFYVTEKADGSSATVYKYNGHFGCCSRNLELKETPNNAIWKIAREHDLETLLDDGLALQFEVVGPGVQGNPMGLKKVEGRLFNVYSIVGRHYFGYPVVQDWAERSGIPMVKEVVLGTAFQYSNDELRNLAEGLYSNGKQREGIVIRPVVEQSVNGERLSFKVINLLYKD